MSAYDPKQTLGINFENGKSCGYAALTCTGLRRRQPRKASKARPVAKRARVEGSGTLIYFMHYNFVRIHQSLRVTPAMAAGVTDRLWELEDVVKLADLDFNF
jgi:hypothetical protein